ncbi:ThiF family adenylyltransferase [Thiobacter aerophilum]|uniref:ThiF family adenylyltransferase n=1 Tax=Thiobacter aerophilum TaxID=3121275 RepID=A0ABV0EG79_9BURK
MTPFDYDTAFSRNIGWLTQEEQARLRGSRVAIAGLGGVGGYHLLTLARLGVGGFRLADPDRFDLANFNRQTGATLATLGRAKLEVMTRAAREINPGLLLTGFPEGLTTENVDAFLEGVDVYVDGLDFFAFEARDMVFAACRRHGIPAVTAAPLGMGAALLVFTPEGMSFEEYFRFAGQPEDEKALRFLVGLAPAALQRAYLMDPTRVDLAAQRGPSTVMACELCAAIAATEVLKILLKRGPVRAAPWGYQFDAYQQRLVHTYRPWGMRNPLQRLTLAVARRKLAAYVAQRPPEAPPPQDIMEQLIELARWAPSGDNTQPWRFQVIDARHLVVHGFDTRDHCVYDLDGHASQLALGALLETLVLAAGHLKLRANIERRQGPDTHPTFDVALEPDAAIIPDPLAGFIRIRSVNRRPYSTRPLTTREKAELEAAVGPEWEVRWFEGWAARWRVAWLAFRNAHLRLTLPEAYAVHRDIIEWNARYSTDRVPDQAIGLDPLTLRLTRWVMTSWKRVRFFNRWLAGTLVPRLELDLLPGLACAAHFALIAKRAPQGVDDYIAAGRTVQRFWLAATRLGLQLQPEMTPVIFSRYAREGRAFSAAPHATREAQAIRDAFDRLMGSAAPRTLFLGRVGHAPVAFARSVRRPPKSLLT